jgi:hypothetical protein
VSLGANVRQLQEIAGFREKSLPGGVKKLGVTESFRHRDIDEVRLSHSEEQAKTLHLVLVWG